LTKGDRHELQSTLGQRETASALEKMAAVPWTDDTRPDLYRPTKRPVTMRLDSDVVEWFKAQAVAGGYQTEMNRILREHVASRKSDR
jgi:uncharacterized protein (DUF4415 family)